MLAAPEVAPGDATTKSGSESKAWKIISSYFESPLVKRSTSMTQESARFSSQLSEVNDTEEYGRIDLQGLLAFFDMLTKENIRLTEVTYCVNHWKWYGVIPLKHHGFVLSCGHFGFLSLDFTSKGILWEVDDVFPELADNTFIAKSYKIDADPMCVKLYCQKTEPFNWYSNECSIWAAGLLKVLRVHDSTGLKRYDTIADLLELEANLDKNSDIDDDRDVCKSRPCIHASKLELLLGLNTCA